MDNIYAYNYGSMSVNIGARVEGGERRGGSGDQDESRREHRREVQRFVRVVDLKS